jgi:hypothetical protein
MSRNLVIVESPAKAKTIEKFLGEQYKVLASFGHVRALPSKQGSVDIEKDFEPKYQVLPESKKHIDAIKKAMKSAERLLLATDPDREGEAISWHLLAALGLDKKKQPLEIQVFLPNYKRPSKCVKTAKGPGVGGSHRAGGFWSFQSSLFWKLFRWAAAHLSLG